MKIKKLAIITPGFVPVPAVKGGAIEQLIEYFIDGNEIVHKYDIDLFTINDNLLDNKIYKYTNLIKIDNKQQEFKWHLIYGVKNKVSSFLHRGTRYSYVRDKIINSYKKNYYDAVLIENNMNLYKELYPKLTNEKIYFHLHNNVDCGDLDKTKEKTDFILKTADKIFVVSNYLKERLVKINFSAKNKITIVYNGLISKNFKPVSQNEKINIKNELGINKNKTVFTFVGRLSKDKGIDKFIQAIQLLKNEESIAYLIVGNNFFSSNVEDKYITRLKKLSEGVKNKIYFTGYIPNEQMYKIYSISDCIVIPTQVEEAFGMVALEAMAMQVPVIASNSGGLPEVLTAKCSFFINRNDAFVKNLSNKILVLASNNKLRKSMGMEGIKRSKEFPQSEIEYFNLLSSKIN